MYSKILKSLHTMKRYQEKLSEIFHNSKFRTPIPLQWNLSKKQNLDFYKNYRPHNVGGMDYFWVNKVAKTNPIISTR